MSIERRTTADGVVRYRARIKHLGRLVSTRTFDRKADAASWEREQLRRLQQGDWVDPRRGRVAISAVAEAWLETRHSVKRRTRETDELMWRRYISPTLGAIAVASITTAEISEWVSKLISGGLSAGTARRALATLRMILQHAVADQRTIRNVARDVKVPRAGMVREGQALSEAEVWKLTEACVTEYADIVAVLAYTGLRWGELAGLQVADAVAVPGPGFRVQRANLLSGGGGEMFTDSLKTGRSRTVPLPDPVARIVLRWTLGKQPTDWVFHAPNGGPLREGNWKRKAGWAAAKAAIGRPTLRVHDLRHTAASLWLGAGADVKVVQRVLGHATATMTLDLYGHLIDDNLWTNVKRLGTHSGPMDELGEERADDGN